MKFLLAKLRSEIYRFIDHLDVENIMSSPLIDLEDNFSSVEQEFTASEKNPWIGDEGGSDYFPLDVSILGWKESRTFCSAIYFGRD